MVILVLPLLADHGPGPAVDDVGPPRLRGGVTPGVVESPACVCPVYYRHPPLMLTCVHCAASNRDGAGCGEAGVNILCHLHMVTSGMVISLTETFSGILTFRDGSMFPQPLFVTSRNKPHAAILDPRILHGKPERQSSLHVLLGHSKYLYYMLHPLCTLSGRSSQYDSS